MPIPTEPIGSIPRPKALIDAISAFAAGRLPQSELDRLYEAALVDTIKQFEATGSPVVTDVDCVHIVSDRIHLVQEFLDVDTLGRIDLAGENKPFLFKDLANVHTVTPFSSCRSKSNIYTKCLKCP